MPQRARERGAQLGERHLHLGGAAALAVGVERLLAREHERDPEQPLHDALVDLAREVDPLLQLAALLVVGGHLAGDGGHGDRLAERPQQVALVVVHRRRAGFALGQHDADVAAGGGHGRAHDAHALEQLAHVGGTLKSSAPSTSRTRSSISARRATGTESIVTNRSAKPPARCRGRRRRARAGGCCRSGRARRASSTVRRQMASHRLLKKASGGEPSPTPESRSDMTSSTSMWLGRSVAGHLGRIPRIQSARPRVEAPGMPPKQGARGSLRPGRGRSARARSRSSQLLSARRVQHLGSTLAPRTARPLRPRPCHAKRSPPSSDEPRSPPCGCVKPYSAAP